MKKIVLLFALVLFMSINANAQIKPINQFVETKFDDTIIKEIIEFPKIVVLRSVKKYNQKMIKGEPTKIYKTALGFILFTNNSGQINKYRLAPGGSITGIIEDFPIKTYYSIISKKYN